MITLLIDTHGNSVMLVLYKENEYKAKLELENNLSSSEIAIPALVFLLKQKNINIKDISDIIVVNGPGSFTGERLGVTIAKTLAYTLDIPIRSITSLEMYLNDDLEGNYDYIAIHEKNGYYIGKIKNHEITDYKYLPKTEYQDFINSNRVIEPKIINFNQVLINARKKEALNPHEVNPFYVKKIEVEK